MVSLHCTLPSELRSGDFLEPGKPADLWECSLGFSKNSEVFLVGKTTLLINSCVHYLLGLTATLNLLPLMMFYELCDIIFYIKSVKSPNTNFNINDFIFVKNSITRSSSHKLIHSISSTSHVNHFYFNRLPRLWNSLPIIPLSLSVHIIKQKLKKFFFDHFLANFDSNNTCSYHFLCPCFKCSATPPSPCFYNL